MAPVRKKARRTGDDNDVLQNIKIVPPKYIIDTVKKMVLNFADLMQQPYYIDKTDFITYALDQDWSALLFFRPRNSMKTTHLLAMRDYCTGAYPLTQFAGLDVSKDESHWDKYRVVYVSFRSGNIEITDAYAHIRECILNGLIGCLSSTTPTLDNQVQRGHIAETEQDTHATVLNLMCVMLRNLKPSKKVLILIDDIDSPFVNNVSAMEEAFLNIFGPVIHQRYKWLKIIMMGTVHQHVFSRNRVKEGILIDEQSIHTDKYFMFTKKEVEKLCIKYTYKPEEEENKEKEENKVDEKLVELYLTKLNQRYGGYTYTNEENLYNPSSIVQFFETMNDPSSPFPEEVSILWYYFNSCDVLHPGSTYIEISEAEKYIWKTLDSTNTDFKYDVDEHATNISNFITDRNTGFMFLLHNGYLTYKSPTDKTELKIPNDEIRQIFRYRRDMFMNLNSNQ